jgi:hypothetical protein
VTRPWPWESRAMIPPSSVERTIVFRQLFESGWHLELGGTRFGSGHRVHGLFDGWSIPATRVAEPVLISYAPQAFATALVILSLTVEVSIALAIVLLHADTRTPNAEAIA